MSDLSPYAPPQSTPAEAVQQEVDQRRELVLAWEKLRIRYNAILALPGILILILCCRNSNIPVAEAIIASIFIAISANLCFFSGPMAELYISAYLRIEHTKNLRKTLFRLGLAFSAFIFLMYALIFAF